MSARLATSLLAPMAAAAVMTAQTPPAPTQPVQTFRTGTDLVMVDVAVRDGGRAVTGLRAEDFVLTDNGVRQRIDSVEATAVPIDLTLVADVSGNARGPWEARPNDARAAQQLQAEIDRVRALLRAGDRLRALAIDTNIQQVIPMQEGTSPLSSGLRVDSGGMSSLFDTLTAALLQPVEPARRHVVVARTKGIDTLSSVDAAGVAAVAERSDALFHLVVMETAFDNEAALSAFQCAMMGRCFPSRGFWLPHRTSLIRALMPPPGHALLREGQMLADAATVTGGGLHMAQMLSVPTLEGTFKKAFDDFRNSYVLRYTLQGVPSAGWHKIEVTVPGARKYTVRARKGYLVEPPATPTPAPRLPSPLRSHADFTAAYEQGAYREVAADVRRVTDPADLLRDFMDAGNPWPGKPQREAALILELVEPAFFSERSATREAAFKAIDRFRRLIRHPIEPDLFERYWYFALLTMLEGNLRPTQAEWYVNLALERFPDEPRFVLSRAIIEEQKTAAAETGTVTAAMIEDVKQKYAAAVALPTTAVEARIRLAFFLQQAKQHKEALTHLAAAAAQTIEEPALRYLHQLALGHVLWSLNRQEESLAAYRAALAIIPTAQSARVALMNALVLQGDRGAAEALAVQVHTENTQNHDPWWSYWQGQYRLHPFAMAKLREMSQ